MVEAVSEWARLDPAAAAAAAFVVDAMPNDDRMDQAIVAAISHAGSADFPMLREWIGSSPVGALKEISRAEFDPHRTTSPVRAR